MDSSKRAEKEMLVRMHEDITDLAGCYPAHELTSCMLAFCLAYYHSFGMPLRHVIAVVAEIYMQIDDEDTL